MRKLIAAFVIGSALSTSPTAIAEEKKKIERFIRPPLPIYPDRAMTRGIVGACNVNFDISTKGKPENIGADCTHEYFCGAAIRAISRAEFPPKIVDGEAVRRTGIVYPIEFSLADDTGGQKSVDPDTPYNECRPLIN